MSTLNRFDVFVEDVGRKVHNLNADALKLLLTNVLPLRTARVSGDLAEIAAGNGYAAGGQLVGGTGYAQAEGVGRLIGDDVVFAARRGAIGPFRYVVLYNSTPVKGPLIGWYDPYGKSLTLEDRDSFTAHLDQANGILTLV
jgi:hypothetical protein